jgi:DNA-binding CsgD family transcriptional regulator
MSNIQIDTHFHVDRDAVQQSEQDLPHIKLTPKEMECLKFCAAGKSSLDIARILNCSEAAVNFHFTNIRRKFNTTSRHQSVVKAIQMGLIGHSND